MIKVTTDNTEKKNSEGKQNNNKKSNEGLITIIILIFLFIIGVFIALSFHYIPSRQMFFPKNNLTFSYTIITEEDITRLCKRYNDASIFEKEAMNNEPIIRKLMEQGLIYENEKVIDNNYYDESIENTVQTKEIETGSFIDSRDGKTYKTICINEQIWMAENLNTDKFLNGDSIPEVKTYENWLEASKTGAPAWCYYENSPRKGEIYGKLYNWFAVNDPRGLAPNGWHVASTNEWDYLITFFGNYEIAAKNLKSNKLWARECGTNESGFSALPGGDRDDYKGYCDGLSYEGYWWSSSEKNKDSAISRMILSNNEKWEWIAGKGRGQSVRCIKD